MAPNLQVTSTATTTLIYALYSTVAVLPIQAIEHFTYSYSTTTRTKARTRILSVWGN